MEEVYGFQTKDILRSAITPEVMQAFYRAPRACFASWKKCPADYIVAHGSLTFELRLSGKPAGCKRAGIFKANDVISVRKSGDSGDIRAICGRRYLNGYLEEKIREHESVILQALKKNSKNYNFIHAEDKERG